MWMNGSHPLLVTYSTPKLISSLSPKFTYATRLYPEIDSSLAAVASAGIQGKRERLKGNNLPRIGGDQHE
jgi:hypothetical protein